MRAITLTLSILLALQIGSALAWAIDPCDDLAASLHDDQRVAAAVRYEDLDAERAIRECSRAVTEQPGNFRFRYQLARALYKAGRHREALEVTWEPAHRGHVASKLALGILYQLGHGLAKDETAGARWILGAARAGNREARYRMADVLLAGRGVAADPVDAARWMHLAAEAGHARAQGELGYMYKDGIGVPRDLAKAYDWTRRAAQSGAPDGQNRLGGLYLFGVGTTKNLTQAATWFRRAADQGDPEAMANLAELYREGLGVKRDPAEALRLYQRAASLLPRGSVRDRVVAYRDAVASEIAVMRRQSLSETVASGTPPPSIPPASANELGSDGSRPTTRPTDSGRTKITSLSDLLKAPPDQAPGSTKVTTDADLIGRIQKGLVRLGYAPGRTDGVVDAPTRSAIRTFEADQGRAVTGAPSETLYIAIELGRPRPAAAPASDPRLGAKSF